VRLADVELARLGGYAALALLCAALCASPLARLLSRSKPELAARIAGMRRALGIAAACAALGHALFAFTVLEISLPLAWSWPHLRMGLFSLGILCALLITSFPTLVRALRLRTWKELHRLAYLAFALAISHALLAPFAAPRALLAIFAGCVLFGLLRLVPRRRADQ
jgi:methionine sulfoxide reductase heme-binding subunit